MGSAQRVAAGNWLAQVDTAPKYSIGTVVNLIKQEFPALSTSKVRYLEDIGLITPSRTATGYRKYSEADIARIRYILKEQRDSYKPLDAIRHDLQLLDAGIDIGERPSVRIVADAGSLVAAKKDALTLNELLDATGAEEELVDALVQTKLLALDMRGRFQTQAINIVTLAKQMSAFGIQPRHLRLLAVNADRCADLIDQSITTVNRRHSEHAHEQMQNLTQLFAALSQALIRQAASQLDN